ncbi:tetratricopeptide repeat protein [Streptomyces macrosporus]|uniref:Tetratricopeptide repeat protein n=1 Tax=Streptomyces macrosporus TaxID=44032 RepID=A0ABP5XJ95_9ACTN
MAQPPSTSNEFSGGEAGNVVQARTVHGGIHLTAPERRGFPPPRQLPLRPAGFVNRRADLDALDDVLGALLSGDGRGAAVVSAVAGAPGVGKTALALHWAHGMRDRFPDGDLYVDMQGYGPGPALTPLRALDTFLRALDTPADSIPETVEERSALFRSLLAGKRVLVVIDNASSSAQVRPLIPADGECFTVVTSRSALPGLVAREGAARVTLDVLSPDESVELLSRFVGPAKVREEPTEALRLAELCGHLPIALRVVGERASNRPRLTLGELVAELEDEQARLDALASQEDELSDTRAAFSWSYRALDPDLRKAFRHLGLHPGPDIGVGAAAALIGCPIPVARRRLRALADVNLVQEVFTNRFRMHDLLRAYALERTAAEDRQDERSRAVRRGLTWYLLVTDMCRRSVLPHSAEVPLVPAHEVEIGAPFGDSAEAWSWFDAERVNVLAALRQAADHGQLDIVWKLALAVSGPLELRSYWSDWENGLRMGLSAARTLGDAFGEAASLLVLGDASWRTGRLDDAFGQYRDASHIAHDIPVPWIEGFARRGMGLLEKERERYGEALDHFEAALRVFRDSGHRRGEGMSLLSMAECARLLGNPEKAVDHGERALRIFREIDDAWTLAWGRLAHAPGLVEVGRGDDAEACLERALDTFGAFGDRRSEAASLAALGDVCERLGKRDEARSHRAAAADLYEALSDPRHEEIRARLAE